MASLFCPPAFNFLIWRNSNNARENNWSKQSSQLAEGGEEQDNEVMEKQPNTSELLATVKTLYLQEDFAGAVQALTKNPQSLPPEIWHYNLGTLHLKNGNWGMGRFHLEKASKAGFVGDMNFKNLSMVKAREEVVDLYRSESLLERTLDYTLLFPASSYVILTPLILAVLLLLWVRLKALKLKFLNSLSFLLIVCAPALFYFFVSRQLTGGHCNRDN